MHPCKKARDSGKSGRPVRTAQCPEVPRRTGDKGRSQEAPTRWRSEALPLGLDVGNCQALSCQLHLRISLPADRFFLAAGHRRTEREKFSRPSDPF